MYINRNFLALFVFIFLMGPVFASNDPLTTDGSILTRTVGQCIELPQSCASCTYITLDFITRPGGEVEYINSPMTLGSTSGYNYTYCNTDKPGDYSYCVIGDVDSTDTVNCKPFKITTTGSRSSSVLNNPALLILGGFSLLFLCLGVFLSLPAFGFLGGLLFALSGVYTMIYGFDNVTDLYTRAIGGTLIGIGFVIIFAAAYEWMLKDLD